MKAKYDFEVNIRTLRRWTKKLNEGDWDLKDRSRKPKTIHHKITPEIEKEVIKLRTKTGFGEDKLSYYFSNLSHKSINKFW